MGRLGQVFYPSNQLTLLRLVFIPFLILSILYEHFGTAFLLALLAGMSDGLDGLLARRLRQQTTLGAYLDPIADKLLLSSCFVALGVERQLPLWLVILVLSRDVLMLATGLVMILTTSLRSFPPTLYGKANTVAQVLTVLVTLWVLWRPVDWIYWLQQAGIFSTASFTVISGLHYAWRTAGRLHHLERTSGNDRR